jgi:hypothetical protein
MPPTFATKSVQSGHWSGESCPPRRRSIGRRLYAVTHPATTVVGGPAAMNPVRGRPKMQDSRSCVVALVSHHLNVRENTSATDRPLRWKIGDDPLTEMLMVLLRRCLAGRISQ